MQVDAGFDPGAALAFWSAAQRTAADGAPPGWTVLHPAPVNRAASLALYAQRARPFYEGARGIMPSP